MALIRLMEISRRKSTLTMFRLSPVAMTLWHPRQRRGIRKANLLYRDASRESAGSSALSGFSLGISHLGVSPGLA